jgi:hypothetical protein
MADTIVNTPASSSNDSSAGWFVAVIILLAVIAGGFYLYRNGVGRAAPSGTNINVTVPNPLESGGAAGGDASGGGATQ